MKSSTLTPLNEKSSEEYTTCGSLESTETNPVPLKLSVEGLYFATNISALEELDIFSLTIKVLTTFYSQVIVRVSHISLSTDCHQP